MLYLRLIREALVFAQQAIIANKVRTFLSLLGITIGIFSVISVLTVFDSIEAKLRKNIEELGSNVLFIAKWPWAMGDANYAWWEYMNRPQASYLEMEEIQKRSNLSDAVAYTVGAQRNLKHNGITFENASINAVSQDYEKVDVLNIEKGRYFSYAESQSGNAVAIVGAKIVEVLLDNTDDPIGKEITVAGRKVQIIGELKKEGDGVFGNSKDKMVMLPVNFARNFIDLNSDNINSSIMVRAKPNVINIALRDELTGIMRSIRKVKPTAKDNFAINETSIITQGFDSIFKVVAIVGWVIGGFSLLVGGFGIANIMFVSVKERTAQIGIQKSLGARNAFILQQFLFEAIFLSMLGGVFGLLIIYIGTVIVSSIADMELVLSMKNIILGMSVSAVIGLVSGLFPAWTASHLDPVEAMRSGV